LGSSNFLNANQIAAVRYGIENTNQLSPPLLVLAGAGTGKTNTIAYRTAELILNGVSPDRILLLTFARRAASELSSRANLIVRQQQNKRSGNISNAKLSWLGTFHSIANRLLRANASAIGLASDFVIMDRSDSADLIDLIRHDLKYSSLKKRFPKKNTCLNIYSRCINSQKKIE